MTPTEVESLVQRAVGARQSGVQSEDDRIEFKREWPDPTLKTARQIAGLANNLNGQPLVYVVGVEDKTGRVFPPGDTEPKEWWEQVRKRFDEVSPVMRRHVTVYLEGGEAVVALVFETDRAPYVLNTGSDLRDVPMRVGGGTASARRHQLIRMLAPSVQMPSVSVMDAALQSATDPIEGETGELSGHLGLYIDHAGGHPVTLPGHLMHARAREGRIFEDLKVWPQAWHGAKKPDSGPFIQSGDVVATGSGRIDFFLTRGREDVRAFHLVDVWTVDFAMGVVGVERPIRLSVDLRRVDKEAAGSNQTTSNWSYVQVSTPPWSDDA